MKKQFTPFIALLYGNNVKRFITFVLLLVSLVSYSQTKRSINVETAGTLPTLIPEAEKYLIEDLTLTGELNGTDFRLLRDMAGCDYLGALTEGKLVKLDLKDAKIVAGGDKYVDTQRITTGTYSSIFFGYYLGFTTKDNILTNYMFVGTNLESIILPHTITEIGEGAFFHCINLAQCVIPKTVVNLGTTIFEDCKSLNSLVVEEGNKRYDSRDNCDAIIETKTNTLIYGCKNTIIPNTVVTIGKHAFFTSNIEKLTIPNGVKTIGYRAFKSSGLKSVVIPQSVETIGEGSFSHCSQLASIIVEDGNKKFDSRENCNAIIETSQNRIIAGCINTVIPNTVSCIGTSAFEGVEFKTIHIQSNVKTIENSAFWNCTSLYSVVIDEGVETIGTSAFRCSNLVSVELPASLRSIDKYAFGSKKLRAVVSKMEAPFAVDESVFTNYDATLYVPKNSIENYKTTAAWSSFKSIKSVEDADLYTNIVFADAKVKELCVANWDTNDDGELSSLEALSVVNLGTVFAQNADIQSFDELKFFEGITSINSESFRGCQNLNSVILPRNAKLVYSTFQEWHPLHVGVVEDNPYYKDEEGVLYDKDMASLVYYTDGNNRLTFDIPNSVTEVGSWAFAGSSITAVTIPSSITSIGKGAFMCQSLNTVTVMLQEPLSIYRVFDDTSNAILFVPTGCKAVYQSAYGWKNFKYILEIGDPVPDEPLQGEVAEITISGAKQVTYMSDKDLDFTAYPDLKAYVATGYDKASGTIWLTRVKEVPANTGFLLMGEADTYEIPVKAGGLSSYYQNMFKGTLEGMTIQTTDGEYTNYYLSDGESGVGFYKVTKPEGQSIGANRAYLPIPTEIPVVGTAGSTETIKVSAAGQVPYYNTESLDFSSLDAQGVKAYTATGYDYNSGTIWLTRVKQVPAKTGILIMAPEGEYPVPTVSVSSVYANMFRGTLEGTTIQTHEEIDGKDYINYYLSSGASGVGFYRVTKEGGVTIGANRCYLPIKNKDAAAGTRSAGYGQNQIAFEEADEVIGIPLFRGIGGDEDETTNLTPALSEDEGVYYNLQGQRVVKPGKGLYIRNGKVVVIK